jgi:hypothetical protein
MKIPGVLGSCGIDQVQCGIWRQRKEPGGCITDPAKNLLLTASASLPFEFCTCLLFSSFFVLSAHFSSFFLSWLPYPKKGEQNPQSGKKENRDMAELKQYASSSERHLIFDGKTIHKNAFQGKGKHTKAHAAVIASCLEASLTGPDADYLLSRMDRVKTDTAAHIDQNHPL